MNDAHIVLVVDRTGSMSNMWDEALNGLNVFIKEQAEAEGTAWITIVPFDSQSIDTLYFAWDANDIPELTRDVIYPRGGTPLYDAIGAGINLGKTWINNNEWFEGKKILAILTDGYENASQEWTKDKVATEIKNLQGDGWDVLYLAANQDAWDVGSQLGAHRGQTMSYGATGQSMSGTYSTLSNSVLDSRSTGSKTVVPDKEEHLDT